MQAALVNQAYDVLKKPLRRAHYMVNAEAYPHLSFLYGSVLV